MDVYNLGNARKVEYVWTKWKRTKKRNKKFCEIIQEWVPIEESISLSGIFNLCTLGNPNSTLGREPVGANDLKSSDFILLFQGGFDGVIMDQSKF